MGDSLLGGEDGEEQAASSFIIIHVGRATGVFTGLQEGALIHLELGLERFDWNGWIGSVNMGLTVDVLLNGPAEHRPRGPRAQRALEIRPSNKIAVV